MYRNIINELVAWYEERSHRILYIKGALGVGKTWTIKDFATAFYDDQKYIDLSEDTEIRMTISSAAEDSMSTAIEQLEFLLDQRFDNSNPAKSLLIFDETQLTPNCGKFFYEFSKRHRNQPMCIIASSMGITEYEYGHPDVFYFVRMRPMTFEEYMIATQSRPLISAIEAQKSTPLTSVEESGVLTLLKEYMMLGGMPKVVKTFIKNRDFDEARKVQEDIIAQYEKTIRVSFSSAMAQRCRRIWKSIPKQLEKDNKKFMYKFVEENARAREYSEATQHLCDLGFIRKLPRLKRGVTPLEEYVDYKSFELFFIDHGLLRVLYKLPMDDSLTAEDLFTEKNKAIAEQYVFEELSSKMGYLYYWTSGATARVPFVYESQDAPVPVDIKLVRNPKAQNIKTFHLKNSSKYIALRVSLEQLSIENNELNVPAYALWNM